ncbi:hypothetical protein CROQUDRAFT_130627 [Cronartium quercuum f. sp. fusiforme G11]|uniref:Uncharacterized protein n=1 Tax=Cronartium quercuum f. sp. fusiforme G11 TaxID=708437 RepID=A0A9P6NNH4_9BASI|nr:hypothetical protein CROQUDRAFT_130627 [Cronartium quercuum f. sp. fusiforme G11]
MGGSSWALHRGPGCQSDWGALTPRGLCRPASRSRIEWIILKCDLSIRPQNANRGTFQGPRALVPMILANEDLPSDPLANIFMGTHHRFRCGNQQANQMFHFKGEWGMEFETPPEPGGAYFWQGFQRHPDTSVGKSPVQGASVPPGDTQRVCIAYIFHEAVGAMHGCPGKKKSRDSNMQIYKT